ncbi:MAG: PH domain-containing protein, partial [Acidobacteria bacterium]|nr:PH domain-containing protein [Acidobacteriota bacterium]
MEQLATFVEKPQTRSMVVYYAISLSIALLSAVGVVSAYTSYPSFIEIDFRVPLIGVIIGTGLAALFGYIHLAMLRTDYLITETDAQARWGLLVKHEEVVQLGSVRSIKVTQEPVQRLFNLGDVILYTTSNDFLALKDLDHPEEKKELIWNLVRQ